MVGFLRTHRLDTVLSSDPGGRLVCRDTGMDMLSSKKKFSSGMYGSVGDRR